MKGGGGQHPVSANNANAEYRTEYRVQNKTKVLICMYSTFTTFLCKLLIFSVFTRSKLHLTEDIYARKYLEERLESVSESLSPPEKEKIMLYKSPTVYFSMFTVCRLGPSGKNKSLMAPNFTL
jgi:hypothetical protein